MAQKSKHWLAEPALIVRNSEYGCLAHVSSRVKLVSVPSPQKPEIVLELGKYKYEVASRWMRLLIGLSTGAVIAIATFLRDLFTVPVARSLLLIAVGSFAISVLFSVFFMSAYTALEVTDTHSWRTRLMGSKWVSGIAELSFYIGFICLVAFIVYNFWFMGHPHSHPPTEPVIEY